MFYHFVFWYEAVSTSTSELGSCSSDVGSIHVHLVGGWVATWMPKKKLCTLSLRAFKQHADGYTLKYFTDYMWAKTLYAKHDFDP